MTLEEAKKQLDRYRQVIRKTTHLQKKGEPGHQQQLAQFKRKRSALLEHLDEAEVLVREADPDYYRRWVDDIIEKPDSWELPLTSDTASLFLIRLRILAPLRKQIRLHPFHFSQDRIWLRIRTDKHQKNAAFCFDLNLKNLQISQAMLDLFKIARKPIHQSAFEETQLGRPRQTSHYTQKKRASQHPCPYY